MYGNNGVNRLAHGMIPILVSYSLNKRTKYKHNDLIT